MLAAWSRDMRRLTECYNHTTWDAKNNALWKMASFSGLSEDIGLKGEYSLGRVGGVRY